MASFAKPTTPRFAVEVHQNPYLPEGGREVHAVITVTATGGGTSGGLPLPASAQPAGSGQPATPATEAPAPAGADAPRAAVVLMVDCSGSMSYPPQKIRHAREATGAAVDALRDGVAFAIVAGTHEAREIYPGEGRLAVAGPATRADAKATLRRLRPDGGTAISTWLWCADRLLTASGAAIRHGILLTDGRNEHEEPGALRAALDACSGHFTCDARGVGTDWEVTEVTGIATALLGTADIVAESSGLAEDFRTMMTAAMGKGVADVALRLWTPAGAEIGFVKQVAPTVTDLTDRRAPVAARAGDYPTGSWGDESRDYHVCVRVPAAAVGQEMLAARVCLVQPLPDGGADVLGQGLVRAVWTDDAAASTAISPQVAHYTGQAELAHAIQQGLSARKAGDTGGATTRLGRAVQLAAALGHADTARLLAKVVDVVDEANGTVRLKTAVAEADEMTLETRSTKTVRVKSG
ncbi:VWA domain-containing protein [Streptomyces sp. JJ66]|uniref:vWA domain-containing protein n=1 Tax=Streptomyces sp. JJ66 TaxID=2803843 RepID=UPI001C5716C8|nr:VWA domain-containing protein [Streptomyces sp. JJ66]MBW1601143.1 VWA domain-containing protein [Streptomyces sp. JJ66]